MPFMIGRKIEMTQQFKGDGTVVPVTLIRMQPNVVTQIRTEEKDGFVALEIGTDEKNHLSKPMTGHLKGLPSVGVLRQVRLSSTEMKLGDTITASVFTPGMKVDVVGVSKGRGFAGVMKRHHFHGKRATHGTKDQMRMPGSIASQRQGPVTPGQRMAGHMGDERVTVKNLEVISVDAAQNMIAVKGAVPGARGSILCITTRDAQTIWQK